MLISEKQAGNALHSQREKDCSITKGQYIQEADRRCSRWSLRPSLGHAEQGPAQILGISRSKGEQSTAA